MRVIGGVHRGRNLRAPGGRQTRPTSDRVREAIFDMLGSILGPDGMRGCTVVDLFAGSGALGIEALSRGASQVTFVEGDPKALSTIRANLEAIGIDEARTAVHRGDVATWLAGAGQLTRFDVALCDPPYATDCWAGLWNGLRASLVVAESSQELVVPEPWHVHRRKRYGSTLVTVVTNGAVRGAAAESGEWSSGAARGAAAESGEWSSGAARGAAAESGEWSSGAAMAAGMERGVR